MKTNKKVLRSILIVDDEEDLVEVLKTTLTPLCDKIFTANNGLEALAIIKNFPELSAVLSDINMPSMNGLELLTEVRQQFNPVPFVVLTGYGDTKGYRTAIKLNATDFLEKPCATNEIIAVMKRAVEYGVELIMAERLIDEFYRTSNLPGEKITQLKRSKRTVMAMRIENEIYIRKKA